MTNLDPAPPVAVPLRLALSTVLLHAASALIRAAEAVSPRVRSDPSGPEDAARGYFGRDYRPPGTPGPEDMDGPLTAFRAGWQRATQSSRSAGRRQGRRQSVVPDGYAQGRADLQLTTLIDPDPRARQVPGLGRVIEPPITGPPPHDPGRPR
jgi:hypothetical protein